MANWKKMAEAFGRATQNPAATERGRRMVFNSKTVKTRPDGTNPRHLETDEQRAFDSGVLDAATDLGNILEARDIPDEARRIWNNYDRDFAQAYGPNEAYKRAIERARTQDESSRIFTNDAENLPASVEEFKARYGFSVDGDMPNRSADIQRRFDKNEDAYTNKRLRDTRKDEWDDAFKSAKEHVKRGYGDSYPEDMAEEGADAFEKQLWDVIDELKAKGRSTEDILGALKSMGQK